MEMRRVLIRGVRRGNEASRVHMFYYRSCEWRYEYRSVFPPFSYIRFVAVAALDSEIVNLLAEVQTSRLRPI